MQLIRTTQELAAACATLADAPFVAVDTEFMRESTYWPKLCLVQAAAPGAEALIDPLAPDIDLQPFLALMAKPTTLKVFHAARQDLEIFLNLMGALPAPIFDAQIGAMAVGLGDSISYDSLVQGMLGRRIDKSHRFTDWGRRPLSEAQLTYALADVTHLRDLYPLMRDRLQAQGRTDWISEELAGLTDPEIYDTAPENAWRRLKLRKTSGDYLVVLEAAAAWRERQAQARDVPRGRILKDDALQEIAEQRPRSAAALERLRTVPKGFGNSRAGQELVRAVDQALSGERRPPLVQRAPPLPSGLGPTIELLKVLLRTEAEAHGVAPRLIANAADVESIAASDTADVAALRGWRRDVFGEKAIALKQGKLALTISQGKVAVEEVR
ncbi:MAG: ribonuclease D [Alphaproteobacteria bacterium]|nr:ribonuclease D [Alphaproteobacteria bacterium]